MAIVSIKNSLSCRAFKIPLPRRFRSRVPKTESPSREVVGDGGSSGVGGGGSGGLVPKVSTKEDEFRQVFRYFDTDNDGKISVDELRDYFASVGDSVSDEEAKKIIREFSEGRGGGEDSLLLEFGEFVKMMELRDSDDDNVLRRAFEVYEVEKGSGYITPEALRNVLRRLGDVKSYQECEAMIRVFDLDGNGVLDYHEFQKMMTNSIDF